MSAGVVSVGRRSYAVGLYWENSPSGRVAQTAKEAAQQPGQQAEFYAIRIGNKEGRVAQFGLGQAASGHKTSMAAFAACLANQQPGSWAGAFRLREGIVVTIVRDELIVPDGDILFADEAEARDRLLQEIGFGGLQKIYAPEAWAIPGADSMPVSLLMDDNSDVVLRPVAIPKKIIIIGAAAVVLVLLVVGGGWFMQARTARLEAERLEQEAAIKRAKEAVNNLPFSTKVTEYPPPHRTWEDKPPALDVVEACRQGLEKVPIVIVGWKMSDLKCDGQSISTNWSRQKGGVSLPLPGGSVSEDLNTASLHVSLPSLKARLHEDLINPDVLTRRYLSQNWSGSIQHTADDPPPSPPADFRGKWNPPPPPWIKRSFTVTVSELPSSLTYYWAGLPGVVVNSMSYSPGSLGGTWTIEGVIYENRI